MKPALVVLPLLLLTACTSGGGDDDPKAAYVAQATKVCEVAKTDADALPRPTGAADLKSFVDNTVAIAKRAQGELAALTPPEADAAELRSKVLDPFAALVTEGEAYAKKVEAAGTDQAELLPLIAAQPKPDNIDLDYLRSYGLGVCADAISG